jgi:hypothetical protein
MPANTPASCTHASGVVTFTLAAADTFTVLVDSTIEIVTGLIAPSLAGQYIFDFVTKSPAGLTLETGSITVTINPEPFAVFNFESYTTTESELTVL